MRAKEGSAIIVGSGHAAVEAALAMARLGVRVRVVTMNVEKVAGMPCNPSLGGPGKAQIISEIDALGGEMALATDAAALSVRVLNSSKGPALRSLRAQVDKGSYSAYMRRALSDAGAVVTEGEVRELILSDSGRAEGVVLAAGEALPADAVILATGVYLESRIVVGRRTLESGPMGEKPSRGLSGALRALGLRMGRFKTGTSPRILNSSVRWEELRPEGGDGEPHAFSFLSKPRVWDEPVCYSTYTNAATHELIRRNAHRAPLLDGTIEGIGPRYCPSIEDKVMRFPGRLRHQIYLELEGADSQAVYLLGLSTSLPEDVQEELVRTLPGLAGAEITTPGYAIEYDYLLPSQLGASLEVRSVPGLFCAGQINGTSGYEEAAAQGLVAGVNAANSISGKPPLVLSRERAYIGVLIDDITGTPIAEPYRMLTGRAEYRLLLRQTNADERLTPVGREIGLVKDDRWESFRLKRAQIEEARGLLRRKVGAQEIKDLLRSPSMSLSEFVREVPELLKLPATVLREAEIEAKYAGFIERQAREAGRMVRYREKRIPHGLNVRALAGLSSEGRDKMTAVRLLTLGDALDAGVSPSDVMILLSYMRGTGSHEN